MRIRILCLLLVMALIFIAMVGCRGSNAETMKSTGIKTEPNRPNNPVLTQEEAKQIALKHAGLTEDLVIGLHAQYEIEHGTPIYDVEFRHREWEYDYEIHADTGEILSFSKDG